MLTKSEFFEALGDTIRATRGQFPGWRVNEERAWEAYKSDPARFHQQTQDNAAGHVGVGVVVNDGPWWEPDVYIVIDTEHDPGSVSITGHEGTTIATLGNVALETHAGWPTAATTNAAERIAAKFGWLVSGDWEVAADSYYAPVQQLFQPVTA